MKLISKRKRVRLNGDTYTRVAVGQCCCGKEVSLRFYTNTCECGLDYSMSGNLLMGEEICESPVVDIISVERKKEGGGLPPQPAALTKPKQVQGGSTQ